MRLSCMSAASALLFLSSLAPNGASADERFIGASAAKALHIASYATDIENAARRFDLPPLLIGSVIAEESGGDASAVSPKGAIGLMQLMPKTYDDMRSAFSLGADPFDPHDNIIAGVAYLREMLDRFGESGFLAAYNAGPGRYQAHLETGEELPRETLNYVADIESKTFGAAEQPQGFVATEHVRAAEMHSASDDGSWQSASLFVTAITISGAQMNGSSSAGNLRAPTDVMRTSDAQALFPSTISNH